MRTAKDFSRKEIFIIAKAYSSGSYTYNDFMKQYNASQKTFYTLINWAVVKCIVPDDIVKAIETVAISNSSNKALNVDEQFSKRVEIRGHKCNMLRLLKRFQYIIPKKEAVPLIYDYIESNVTKSEFCKMNYMTTRVFNRTIIKAIVAGWINLKTVKRLQERFYVYNNPEEVDKRFAELLAQRKENEMAKKKQ